MAGIYIHIPFCKKRCIYCDFYSTTLGHLKDRYINAVEKEIEIRKDYAGNETIETIYFGGGTPSQLKSEDIKMIISAINKVHNVKIHVYCIKAVSLPTIKARKINNKL